jgi:hypothetical protein
MVVFLGVIFQNKKIAVMMDNYKDKTMLQYIVKESRLIILPHRISYRKFYILHGYVSPYDTPYSK